MDDLVHMTHPERRDAHDSTKQQAHVKKKINIKDVSKEKMKRSQMKTRGL